MRLEIKESLNQVLIGKAHNRVDHMEERLSAEKSHPDIYKRIVEVQIYGAEKETPGVIP